MVLFSCSRLVHFLLRKNKFFKQKKTLHEDFLTINSWPRLMVMCNYKWGGGGGGGGGGMIF